MCVLHRLSVHYKNVLWRPKVPTSHTHSPGHLFNDCTQSLKGLLYASPHYIQLTFIYTRKFSVTYVLAGIHKVPLLFIHIIWYVCINIPSFERYMELLKEFLSLFILSLCLAFPPRVVETSLATLSTYRGEREREG